MLAEADVKERRVRVWDTAAGPSPRLNTVEILSYGLTGGALWLALALKLLGSLLAGLFVFQLIHLIAPHLEKWFPSQRALGRADSAIGHRDGRAEPLDDLRLFLSAARRGERATVA